MNQNSPKIGTNVILLGLVIVAAIVIFGPQLFGGGGNPDTTNGNDVPTTSQQSMENIDLGSIVVARGVDRDGCPVDAASTLYDVDEFYVVAPDSQIPEGTDIFVRLYQDDRAVEDLPVITADQDYDSTCINFIVETTDGRTFNDGDYEAEIYINGNPYDTIDFSIR